MAKVHIPILASKKEIIEAMRKGDRLDTFIALMQIPINERQDPKYRALYEALAEVYTKDDLIDFIHAQGQAWH